MNSLNSSLESSLDDCSCGEGTECEDCYSDSVSFSSDSIEEEVEVKKRVKNKKSPKKKEKKKPKKKPTKKPKKCSLCGNHGHNLRTCSVTAKKEGKRKRKMNVTSVDVKKYLRNSSKKQKMEILKYITKNI
jgi:outer membrane biosynthesis protein TonB